MWMIHSIAKDLTINRRRRNGVFSWKYEYSVGITKIDDQHKEYGPFLQAKGVR
jgi:hypothetical protein